MCLIDGMTDQKVQYALRAADGSPREFNVDESIALFVEAAAALQLFGSVHILGHTATVHDITDSLPSLRQKNCRAYSYLDLSKSFGESKLDCPDVTRTLLVLDADGLLLTSYDHCRNQLYPEWDDAPVALVEECKKWAADNWKLCG